MAGARHGRVGYGEFAAGRILPLHRLQRALASMAGRSRCSRWRCSGYTSPHKGCKFATPSMSRRRSTAKSRRYFLSPCPATRYPIRAAKCRRGWNEFASRVRGPQFFLRALQTLSGALAATPKTAISALSYREDALDMTVTAPSLAAISQLTQYAGKQGVTAEIQSSNPVAAGVEAHLHLRTQASRARR